MAAVCPSVVGAGHVETGATLGACFCPSATSQKGCVVGAGLCWEGPACLLLPRSFHMRTSARPRLARPCTLGNHVVFLLLPLVPGALRGRVRTRGHLAPRAQRYLANTVSSQTVPRGLPTDLCTASPWGPPASLRPGAMEVPRFRYILGVGAAPPSSSQCCVHPRRSGPRVRSLAAPGLLSHACPPPTPPQSLGFCRACSAAWTAWVEPTRPQGALPTVHPVSTCSRPLRPAALPASGWLSRGGACRWSLCCRWTPSPRGRLIRATVSHGGGGR